MAEPPSGTVALLFTDIEGSARRWELHASAMQAALARHDALLRHTIGAHGGHVFKTAGDAFFAAFPTTPVALDAALDAQRALHAEDWQPLEPLRIRMALHVGAVEARDGDYFGAPLNRAARLLSAGHGGQILLSRVAQELVRDALPSGVSLRSFGEQRLKDLFRPEHVFQVVAPGLPADFPPLNTLDTRPTNLPIQPTALIGREREAEAVSRLLQGDARLVTLTGPGGTGKTRLGLQVGADLLDSFADGVWFVNLAPLTDPNLVASAIAQTLGVTESSDAPLVVHLSRYLRNKHLLLLLDNFEQVGAAAPLVADLLAGAPKLSVLVTSRAALHLSGEREMVVPPLALPDPKRLPPLERLTQYEAVRLFIQRAQAVKADFTITAGNAPAVAEICVRLDGLPLAIELAAARVKLLPPQAMLARLQSRLRLLTSGARDLPARQQTLRSTIDWSYSLLDPAERTLFARLAVFIGGRTLDAIEAVCNADGDLAIDPFDGVASLVDKSMLRQEAGPDGEPRFVMLETIHEYAWEQLAASGEAETMRDHHVRYFLKLAETAEPQLQGPEQLQWLDHLEAEHGNLRAALQSALDRGEPLLALQLSGALGRFWLSRGYVSEGRRWLDAALAASESLAVPARAQALNRASGLAHAQCDYLHAARLAEESVSLARVLGDRQQLATALWMQGNAVGDQGDYARSNALYEESLALMRVLGDTRSAGVLLQNFGATAMDLGDYARAVALLEEALVVLRAHGDTLNSVGPLINLGHIALYQGEAARAQTLLRECLGIGHTVGDKLTIAFALGGLAGVAALQGHLHRAAQLWGAAEALRDVLGIGLPPADEGQFERLQVGPRFQLGDEAWRAAWAEGRALSAEAALALALEPAPEAAAMVAPLSTLPAGLSEREAEVLRLVAQGLTNAQIAERLVLSPYTVNAHLRTIFGKIGVSTRAAATRWASDNHLV